MLAAIAVEKEGLDAVVPETLAAAGFIYIMELEDGEVQAVLAVDGEEQALRTVTEHGCRALICGQLSESARELLRQREVLCYDGYLYQAQQVRRLLYTGVLPCLK